MDVEALEVLAAVQKRQFDQEFDADDLSPELRHEVARWQRTWEQFETEIEDILDAGTKVVLLVRQTGTGKTSGVPAEIRYGQVFVVRNSVIVSMKTYLDRAEALEAAGL